MSICERNGLLHEALNLIKFNQENLVKMIGICYQNNQLKAYYA